MNSPESSSPETLRTLASSIRSRIKAEQATLRATYEEQGKALPLLRGRAALVDELLCELWNALDLPPDYTLAAVGGYGHGELFPASDVDLLILVPVGVNLTENQRLESFVGLLWDIGLDIGHSVRDISGCLEEAERDITVRTALLEARFLCGNQPLFDAFTERYRKQLDPESFFKAKQLEQAERYARFNDTPYSLEPNCKENPGGLRDLHIIQWIAQASRLGNSWQALAASELLTAEEARQLTRAEDFLRHVRIRLHHLLGRREDRLLFDYQEALAQAFKLSATRGKRASEVLMQRYYRNAKLVTQLNTLVLQNFATRIDRHPAPPPIVIDGRFQMVRELLDLRDENLFENEPRAILEAFHTMQRRTELKGMTTRTLRALWQARSRINAAFRRNPEHRALFLSIFKERHLVHELRRMNQYDILGRCLPAFGRIVGQMQHDLFHIYTVDQHILQVIRNLRRLSMPEFAHEYPFCSRLTTGFDKFWLLYIAALFHDIAKGRGGDHSKLGAVDALHFCRDYGFPEDDTELITFLVTEHITMSTVAQKQDLADPDVVHAFADKVQTERRLTALYLLTVCDVRGTSPKVWNAWKGKLLEDLYRMTLRVLRGDTLTAESGLQERQEEARRLLRRRGLRPGIEDALWRQFDTVYFMRHDADEIQWHTHTLYHRPSPAEPVVRSRLNPFGEGLQVMIYVADQPALFARLCGFFSRLGYSIVDAMIHTTAHGYALDSFVLLDPSGELPYRDMISLIEHDLVEQLRLQPALTVIPPSRIPRQVKHFPTPPTVSIRADDKRQHHVMSITAIDRNGLLYAIARVLAQHGITLHTAKIATLGDLVEDTFLISGRELNNTATLVKLEEELLQVLKP
jgi:[protein-PII] uridylyltransferase